jgi:hypothetical protein
LNANVHFHSLVLDGVFSRPAPGAAPVFHPLPAPTDEEIAPDPGAAPRARDAPAAAVRTPARGPQPPRSGGRADPLLAGYAAASIQERIATGPLAGHPVRRLHTAAAAGAEGA